MLFITEDVLFDERYHQEGSIFFSQLHLPTNDRCPVCRSLLPAFDSLDTAELVDSVEDPLFKEGTRWLLLLALQDALLSARCRVDADVEGSRVN